MRNKFQDKLDGYNSGVEPYIMNDAVTFTITRLPLAEDPVYKKDSYHLFPDGNSIGLWPKRYSAKYNSGEVFNYFIEVGDNVAAWMFSTSRRYRTFTFQWYEKGGVTWFRDITTLVDNWDGFSAEYIHDDKHVETVVKHGVERGFTYWQFVLLHFTRPVLEVLSDEEREIIYSYWWVAQAKTQHDKDRRAAKLTISLGLHSQNKKVVDFCLKWIETQLERLKNVKDYVVIEVWNEILGWQVVDPRSTHKDYGKLQQFTTEVLKWVPVDTSCFDLLKDHVRGLGFKVLDDPSVHAYYDWMEPTATAAGRMTRWYLGYPLDPAQEWQASEMAVGPIPEGQNPYGDRCVELRRLWYDLVGRGASRICSYSRALISKARKYAHDPVRIYDQFRSSDHARAWLSEGELPLFLHEGACVLNDDYNKTLTELAWSVRFF